GAGPAFPAKRPGARGSLSRRTRRSPPWIKWRAVLFPQRHPRVCWCATSWHLHRGLPPGSRDRWGCGRSPAAGGALPARLRRATASSRPAARQSLTFQLTSQPRKTTMANLKDKVGIVTGGGTGIGRATALAMARAGAVVVICNRDAAKGEEVVALIRQAGDRAVFQKTDVSKPADVKGLVDKAVAEFGRLDVAFNNAGIDGEQVPLHEQDIDKAEV